MFKGFKIRIYPTKAQEELIWKHINACRFMWNYMLEIQQKRHENKERYMSRFDMNKHISVIKTMPEYSWLYEVSNASLQRVCSNLMSAYNALFAHNGGFPKFKSKKTCKTIYPIRSDTMWFGNKKVHVEKLGKIKYTTDFELPKKERVFRNANISFLNGKYYLGFVLECENQATELTKSKMGIDLGIKELAVVAFDDKKFVYHNINKSNKMKSIEKRILHHQKSASRKREANNGKEKSNNLKKEEAKIKRLRARQANIRNNYIHQITHELVSMRPMQITMETLSFEDMLCFKSHNKNVGEQCFYEFERQMMYKSEKCGIRFIKADKYFLSSKTCSQCGSVKHGLKLSDRIYVCSECGLCIDRDYNAAINLMKYEAQ